MSSQLLWLYVPFYLTGSGVASTSCSGFQSLSHLLQLVLVSLMLGHVQSDSQQSKIIEHDLDTHSRLLCRLIVGSLALAVCGFALTLLNLIVPGDSPSGIAQ